LGAPKLRGELSACYWCHRHQGKWETVWFPEKQWTCSQDCSSGPMPVLSAEPGLYQGTTGASGSGGGQTASLKSFLSCLPYPWAPPQQVSVKPAVGADLLGRSTDVARAPPRTACLLLSWARPFLFLQPSTPLPVWDTSAGALCLSASGPFQEAVTPDLDLDP
jgi:hypothetical protein